MSFRLKPHEPVAKGIRRVLLSQIDGADKRLGDKPSVGPEAIHEARKCFKRIRSTLRLIRSGIGEEVFERENMAFREIAGLLAGARDRHVLLETVTALEAAEDVPDIAAAVAQIKRSLLAEPGETTGRGEQAPLLAQLTAAREGLACARKRIRKLQLAPDSFAVLAEGLRRTQRDTLRTMKAAWALETDEAFHDWRKNVQRHWRHMKLLAPVWPELLEARAATARELSQCLGEDHDLSMLIAFGECRAKSGLTARQANVLTAACRREQAKARTQARMLGARLAAEKPGSLSRHIARLWEVAAARPSETKESGGEADYD
jgi:CHAD domain-containing protein